MADEIRMSPAFNEQVKRYVRESMRKERSTQNPQGRWHGRGGGSSGGLSLMFQIVSSDPSIRTAIAQIEMRTFTGEAYGSSVSDTVVTIYDPAGCYLNEPNVDLTGRFGYADLFLTGSLATASTGYGGLAWWASGEGPSKIWVVRNLCCPQGGCSD